jgi:hypothetical protein
MSRLPEKNLQGSLGQTVATPRASRNGSIEWENVAADTLGTLASLHL